jgi:hypothetical protein
MTGRIYLLNGVTGNSPSPTLQTFAQGLEDVMGVKVIDDRIYVSGGNTLIELLDADKNGVSDGTRVVYTHPGAHARAEFLYGIHHRDNAFYLAPGSANLQQDPPDRQLNSLRGLVIAVDATSGARQVLSMGFRQPSGIGFGPNGDIFVPDVQGNWLPACKLIHVQQGKFFGYKHTPAESYDNMPETRAAVYMPDEDMASSPGNPLYVTQGPYAGQFLMGDTHYGGINRYFLEKVNGQYQGAAFQFTGGLEAGTFRLAWGPDDMLYVGMIGESGDWHWNGQYYGLQKLRFNNTSTAYEMLAVRSRPGGLEIEFNKPVGAAASAASSYAVQSFYYTPTQAYGGPKQGNRTDAVGTVQVCADNRRVFLPLPNFSAGRIYWVRVPGFSSFRAADNSPLWTREAYYANNAVGTGSPCDPPTPVDPAVARGALLRQLQWNLDGGNLMVRAPFYGPWELRVRDLKGALLARALGHAGKPVNVSSDFSHKLLILEARDRDGMVLRRTAAPP